jgi:hypothetical protein
MIMKIRNVIYILTAVLLSACNADDEMALTPEQQSMLGKGVDFNTSMADPFVTRAITNNHDGSFNDGDQMRIFRQYAKSDDATGTTFDASTEIFRTYYLKMDFVAGMSVSLGSDWIPMAGKLKSDAPGETASQSISDSLTWENGRIVRFRAWGRSNLAGRLAANTKESYYPDYTVSDWVTVSGPTQSIPLIMRHLACRIGFTTKSGNELSKAEICLDWEDYKRKDNADTDANDAVETGKTDDKAKAEAAEVETAIKKMCMPAGVDDKTFLLTAMTTARYDTTTYFKNIEMSEAGIVRMNDLYAEDIAENVQRPMFNSNDGRFYLMTIPVDMSIGNAGQNLVLPACTRFKVWLRGESDYHIFALSDIKNGSDPMFPNGLTLKAGYSYLFNVGYHYNQFTITPADSFSWEEQDSDSKDVTGEVKSEPALDIAWFTDAYKTAAEASLADNKVDFKPVFNITSDSHFVTFAKLVNGTALNGLKKITRGELIKNDNNYKTYYWHVDGENDEEGKPKNFTSEEAKQMGYMFYFRFYPSVSTEAAYVEEECFNGPIDFNGLEVKLDADIDLEDCSLPSIGTDIDNPFRGKFNGNGHTLSNVNMQNGYLFDNVMDGVITNLKIESTHNTCLVNNAKESSTTTGWGCYIAGVSLLCPSGENSIAVDLGINSYVVGCIHVGNATGALVGKANNLAMMGCMQAASGIASGNGALLGEGSVTSSLFMYNYYDVELSPGTNAVGATTDAYGYDKYIRGSKSHILKAVHDYKVSDESYEKMNDNMKREVYGIAPWTAMNMGIDKYNGTAIGKKYPCVMSYSISDGYSNRYPTLNLK